MTNFKNYFANLESNGEGNKNMASFANALSGDTKKDTKTAIYDADGIALGADSEKNCHDPQQKNGRITASPRK